MTEDLLTPDELEAVNLTADLANLMRRIIGEGPTADHDWSETAAQIHVLQSRIMGQAAARAYPDLFRLMGGRIGEPPTVTPATNLVRNAHRGCTWPDGECFNPAHHLYHPDAAAIPPRDKEFVNEAMIALTYTPIDPEGLFKGCLSSEQAYDGGWRVLSQLIEKGWTIEPPAGEVVSSQPYVQDDMYDRMMTEG